MRVSTLARVRWRILEWLLPFLLFVLLVNNIQPIRGAPQTHSRFSNPQRQQNPPFRQTGQFRIIPDEDDFEDVVFSRQRNFGNGAPSSFGVPLGATRSGVRQETFAANGQFGAPISGSTTGANLRSQQAQPASFGVPLSATHSGPSQRLPAAARSHFGVPLSATRPEIRQEISAQPGSSLPGPSHKTSHFGVPLSATRSGNQQSNHLANRHFGTTRAQSGPAFSVRRDSLEDTYDDVYDDARSHFSVPTHRNLNKQRFLFGTDDRDDNISIERFDKSSEILSLGRRFHPEGIPRLSDATLTNVPLSVKDPVISNPYIFTPDVASIDRDSIEDDDDIDDDTFIVLSPMVKAYNPSEHNERLSLSNDFLNQYNFVDVQGSTHWGYKTDSQYQDHKIHDSGTMEGNFGWTSPEGSEVNIKYIADEGGYRVVSSSGIYTRENEDVRRLKELHLAEHEKAKIHHQNIKAERNEGQIGVPLPSFKGAQGSSISGSGGLVIIPDEDDLPLVPSKTQTGVPLPTLTDINLKSEPEVGVFIDSSAIGVPLPTPPHDRNTGFGVPLPTPSQDRNTGFGVPLPTPSHDRNIGFGVPLPDHTVTRDHPSSVSHSFGVPLPGPSLTGAQNIGVSLPDPTLSRTSGNQAVGVPLPGVGAPIPDPSFTINENVGVPLPNPNLIGTQKVGVPFTDSTFSGAQNFGVPLPDPTFSRDENLRQSDPGTSFSGGTQGIGVPLADSTFSGGFQPETTFSGTQGVGVPLPDPNLSGGFQPETTFSGTQGVGVPLPDPNLSGAFGTGAALPDRTFSRGSDSNLGVSLPDPTFIESSHSGVPLPGPGTTFSGVSQGQTVGVPLPAPTLFETTKDAAAGVPRLSGTDKAGVPLPGPTFSGDQNAVPLSDPALSGFQIVGVPLPDPSLSGSQGVGIPFAETSFPGTPAGESVGVPLSGSNQRLPHGGATAGVTLPDQFLSGNRNFGVPLFDPVLTSQHGTIPQSDPTITGNEAFGVPLAATTGHHATGDFVPDRASVGGPDVDLLQGPPVEQLDPFITNNSPRGLDPCLNSKLHPTLLPPHCANINADPNQRLGKSLINSRSKKEQPQDSFIVVVNSDIFH